MTSRNSRGTTRTASPEDAEAPASGVPVPQFLQPEPPRPRRQDSPDPDRLTVHPQEAEEETRGSHPEDASAGDELGDGPAPMAAGSTPASTKAPRLRPLVTAQQIAAAKGIVTAALMGATALVNRRTKVHPEDDRWLMTEEELDAVGGPLARILARRTPIPGDGEDASDIADLVEGVVGLIGYTMRQLFTERPAPPIYVPQHQEDEQPAAPAGPGATSNPLDPAYRVG
jgi:hypothetical protein